MATASPVGRVSFPSLVTPNDFNGKKSYQVTLIFDHGTDLSKIEAAIKDAIKKKWGEKVPRTLDLPIRNGDDKERPEYQGRKYITFRCGENRRPQLVNADLSELTADQIYPGMYGRVSFTAFGWENSGKKGVSLALCNFQKVKDGERLDSRTEASDDFDAVGEAAEGSSLFA